MNISGSNMFRFLLFLQSYQQDFRKSKEIGSQIVLQYYSNSLCILLSRRMTLCILPWHHLSFFFFLLLSLCLSLSFSPFSFPPVVVGWCVGVSPCGYTATVWLPAISPAGSAHRNHKGMLTHSKKRNRGSPTFAMQENYIRLYLTYYWFYIGTLVLEKMLK